MDQDQAQRAKDQDTDPAQLDDPALIAELSRTRRMLAQRTTGLAAAADHTKLEAKYADLTQKYDKRRGSA